VAVAVRGAGRSNRFILQLNIADSEIVTDTIRRSSGRHEFKLGRRALSQGRAHTIRRPGGGRALEGINTDREISANAVSAGAGRPALELRGAADGERGAGEIRSLSCGSGNVVGTQVAVRHRLATAVGCGCWGDSLELSWECARSELRAATVRSCRGCGALELRGGTLRQTLTDCIRRSRAYSCIELGSGVASGAGNTSRIGASSARGRNVGRGRAHGAISTDRIGSSGARRGSILSGTA